MIKLTPNICRILPFAIYIAFLVINSVLRFFNLQDLPLLESWLYPAKILIIMLSLIWLWRNFIELTDSPGLTLRDCGNGIFAGILVFVLWINLDKPWATFGSSVGYNPIDPATNQMNWALATIRIFGASIVVPLMEELFWRSFFMRWITSHKFLEMDPGKVGIWAFSVTAVMFASEHNLFLAGLLAGVAYNWLYIRSRNLWVPIMAHSVTNGLLGLWVLTTHNWQLW